jgi:hypothetical protein
MADLHKSATRPKQREFEPQSLGKQICVTLAQNKFLTFHLMVCANLTTCS